MPAVKRLPTFVIVTVGLLSVLSVPVDANRSFAIDYENDTFLMDGEPFQYAAGSFHYFRALPQSWSKILRSMRAAGLNAVTTYVEWSLHNPQEGVYHWDGTADIEQFIALAQEEDLYVILRPGPYICAERDMGGYPYWLLHKYPAMQLRTNDINHLREVRKWYAQLFSRLEGFMYGKGGPIIMVQVENEYGSYFACDHRYTEWLRDETERYVKGNAVLFTNNAPDLEGCGSIANVLSTLDFGTAKESEIDEYWAQLRKTQPNGPLVNAEFYPGWMTYWQESKMATVDTDAVVQSLSYMLRHKVNVNIYMFFGGTNYGFTTGADRRGPGLYAADVTSYDYDAPLDESGDPTPKYFAIREAILQYFPAPNVPTPIKEIKMALPPVMLNTVGSILSPHLQRKLSSKQIVNRVPLTFEALGQNSGLVVYSANIPSDIRTDPFKLTLDNLHDRAYVFVDSTFIGILSRENQIHSIPVGLGIGKTLHIVVENQGRINFGISNDFKGIVGSVYANTKEIFNWTMTGVGMEDTAVFKRLAWNHHMSNRQRAVAPRIRPMHAYYGFFNITAEFIADTYLDPTGWGKGVAIINGVNIGRYWPEVGPQITLYVSKHILKPVDNLIVLVEYQKNSESTACVTFTNATKNY